METVVKNLDVAEGPVPLIHTNCECNILRSHVGLESVSNYTILRGGD